MELILTDSLVSSPSSSVLYFSSLYTPLHSFLLFPSHPFYSLFFCSDFFSSSLFPSSHFTSSISQQAEYDSSKNKLLEEIKELRCMSISVSVSMYICLPVFLS